MRRPKSYRLAPSGLAIIIGAGPTSGRGIARVLARADGGNLAVALVTRSAHKLNQLRDSLRQETNGVLHAFPTQPYDLYQTFQKIRKHHDFKDLKLKLAICHIKNDAIVPDDEELTAEALVEGFQACKTEPEEFAEKALELIYEQNGGKTLLADTDGVKKGTIIFTSTLGVLRRNSDYMANKMTSFTSTLATRVIAKKHSKYGVHCVHAISVGRIVDGDTEETRTGKHMRAEDVGQMYLWLSQQPSSVWAHELELRPAQEPFLKFRDSYVDY